MRMPNLRSFSVLEQNAAFFVTSAADTSSAFIVDCTAIPGRPTLKLTEAFERQTTHEDTVFPLFFRCSDCYASLHPKVQST